MKYTPTAGTIKLFKVYERHQRSLKTYNSAAYPTTKTSYRLPLELFKNGLGDIYPVILYIVEEPYMFINCSELLEPRSNTKSFTVHPTKKDLRILKGIAESNNISVTDLICIGAKMIDNFIKERTS